MEELHNAELVAPMVKRSWGVWLCGWCGNRFVDKAVEDHRRWHSDLLRKVEALLNDG